jgi:hypothetical protein
MTHQISSEPAATVSLDWLTGELRAVASGSATRVTALRHPLGFICLPIQRDGVYGLCVHLWTDRLARAAPTTSGVHCHSWDLHSRVLYGSVRNTVMHAVETGENPTHRVFEVHSAGGRDELRATPRMVRCTEGAAETSTAGDVYTLSAGVFHTTEVAPGEETATVVFGQTLEEETDRSLGPVGGQTHWIQRRYCDAADTSLAARIVVTKLETTRHA